MPYYWLFCFIVNLFIYTREVDVQYVGMYTRLFYLQFLSEFIDSMDATLEIWWRGLGDC